jgi:hypothetical protein
MEDRDAIESMLRVYGPPATEIFTLNSTLTLPYKKNIPFLPYVTAISTSWAEENMDEESRSNGRGSIIRGTKTLQPKAPTTQIWPIKPCPSHLSEGAWSRPGHFNKRVLPPHRF